MRYFLFVVLLASLLALPPFSVAQVSYIVTDLGTVPGTQASFASGINNSGQVVGGACNLVTSGGGGLGLTVVQNPRAFLYSGGTMQDLSTLPGVSDAAAFAINNSGEVALGPFRGFGTQYIGGHSFLYSDGTMHDLGTLGNGGSYACGINNGSQVAGWSNDTSGFELAFIYNGTMQNIGTAPGWNWSAATGINDKGQVVGWGGNTNMIVGWHAFLYSGGTMQDLGTLDGNYGHADSQANAINNIGQIAGWTDTSRGHSEAFLYSDGTMSDLGTLAAPYNNMSSAYGINNIGQVVGSAEPSAGTGHAFLYSNGTMLDLNSLIPESSGWQLTSAAGINDNGWIVGQGINPAGQTHAFMLTPVPEPSTLALLGMGAFGLLAWAWRRNQRVG